MLRSISALIQRAEPQFRNRRGCTNPDLELAEQERLFTDLDGSCLFSQGTSGSGKTGPGSPDCVAPAKRYALALPPRPQSDSNLLDGS